MWRISRNIPTISSVCSPSACQQTPLAWRLSTSASRQQEASAKADATPSPVEQPKTPPPPPPRPPKRRGRFFWKLLGLAIVAEGGLVGYSWYDPKFKKQVEDNVPYAKEYYNLFWQYMPPPLKSQTEKPAGQPKLPAPERSLAIDAETLKKESLVPKKDVASPKEETAKEKKEREAKKKQEERERKKKQEEEKRRKEKERVEREIKEREAERAAENAALETILSDTLGEAQRAVMEAIDAHKAAAASIKAHTEHLKKAMDTTGEVSGHEGLWQAVAEAQMVRADASAKADQLTEDASLHLEKLHMAITDGKSHKVTQKNKSIRSTEEQFNKISYDHKSAIAEHEKAASASRVMSKYRDLVKKGKVQFQKELESIMPEVKLGQKGGKLTEDELNSLIAHAHRRIEQLQHQVAEYQTLEQQHIQVALDKQVEEDNKLADEKVARERERMIAQERLDKESWEEEAQVGFEQELRQHLARQAAAHSDHLAEVLKLQAHELDARFQLLLADHLVAERDGFHTEVAGWIARLKGIEAAVDGRAEMEKEGRKAQELWLACVSLENVIRTGNEGAETDEQRLKPLAAELAAIQEAGINHPLVRTVVEAVPAEAVRRGVHTEESLLDRFAHIRRVCRRVAMVDETGGTLFKYFLSYVQSLFVFRASRALSDADAVDPTSLNTFALLDNASYCLERGDLEQALRFMNQLRDEPRKVARDWIKEARLLLETRQAADALLAHASATGLGSLF